jgi:hypothetical protein
MVPSVLTPHVWYAPELTDANVPVGGVATFPPQQAMVESVRIPHV